MKLKDINAKHNQGDILCDQLIRLTGYASIKKFPDELRRIVFYTETLNMTFVYLTNNIEISAEQVALLYKYRWAQVEIFFKWIKQHLKIKSFWGTTESDVRLLIFCSITAYCMVAIVEHNLQPIRSNYEVLRILSASILDKTPIKNLLQKNLLM
jgi:IS4 transposase